jgi:hypothetical protein
VLEHHFIAKGVDFIREIPHGTGRRGAFVLHI